MLERIDDIEHALEQCILNLRSSFSIQLCTRHLFRADRDAP